MNQQPSLPLAARGSISLTTGTRSPLLFMMLLIALLTIPFLYPPGSPLRVAQVEETAAGPNVLPDASSIDPMANPIVRQAIQQLREETGQEPDTAAIVDRLNRITTYFYRQGKYFQAEQIVRAALEFAQYKLGLEHPKTLASLNNLALLYEIQGRYGEAEPLHQRALAASERVLGIEHPDTLTSLNNLAVLYYAQGHYGKAEPLYQRALATRERLLGKDHPDTLQSLNNLAFLYQAQGRYGKAEPLYQRALAVSKRVLGQEHPNTLKTLNNLAGVYDAQGRYEEVEPLYKESLAANEHVLGKEHPDTLTSLNNLAMLYQAQGRYGDAEPLLQRTLTTRERVLGINHPDTLGNLNNLAVLYNAQGRYGEAEPIYQRALAARERVLGKEHPDTLTSLNNLAMLYQDQGRYVKAEPILQRVLAASEGALGIEHPNTLTMQLNLVVLHINSGKIPLALAGLRRMDERLQGFVGDQLGSTLSEKVRRQWLRSQSSFQNVVFTLAVAELPQDIKRKARQLAANVLLRWKRLAGEGEAVMARIARASDDPKVRELAGQLARERSQLSRLVHRPQSQYDKAAVDAARDRVEKREVQLAEASGAYQSYRASRSVNWQQVRDALPTGSALISLRAFNQADFKTGKHGKPRWLAMVIPAKSEQRDKGPAIILQDLGPMVAMAESFGRLREAAASESLDTQQKAAAHHAARRLYARLFGQLDAELASYDRLYIAPDGILDLVAFARLVLPDGRYWAQRQTLHQVRNGRDLLRTVDVSGTRLSTLLAFGGVNYDKFPTGDTDNNKKGASAHGTDSIPATPDSPMNLSLTMNQRLRKERGGFKTLPFTGREVSDIIGDYRDLSGHTTKAWYGAKASEGRLKDLLSPSSKPPRVLHLATHGFFLSDKTERTERPMTLGGLAFAGANRGLEKGETGPDGEDGILYAMEARDLNLQGTELVVLSACDTGKGEVDYSEGVYGLTRAFRIAGARNILMTLWPLNDQLAGEFMGDFYRNWLGGSASTPPGDRSVALTPAQALHKTRLDWIESGDESRRDPRHWAPYVLVE
uniref:Tetratricopeptide repeat-containing protein n=1 Tax=Candidatus Kentrum sp. MB TaxID=2138164 RepID=A0A450XTF4_9GAMM|nr:MAG: Tetratricopeptide repeat-containing protein [Candidatus Kentron sp. MB]VFK75964.1 MAG: Tetratricopeptide repeat-containing protein [Candidatus Kentron sp. MB]